MARYRITELSYIDGKLVGPGEKAGDEIESDDFPAPHWEPLDDAAKKAKKRAEGQAVPEVPVEPKTATPVSAI